MAAVGDGFVAVGYGPLPGEGYFGRHQGYVWRSADGLAWTAETDPAFQFVTPEEVVALGDSLYLFGTISTCDALISEGCVESPDAGWAVWRSAVGGPWERLPQFPQMQFGGVDGVAATASSLLAFGWTGDDAQAIAWTSTDGENWSATTDLAGMTQVTAAAATPGGVVLFGDRFSDAIGNSEPVAATAAEGASFTVSQMPALLGASIRSVAAGAGGLVAVGDRESDDLQLSAVALHSTDGASWNEAAAQDGSFADSGASFVHAIPKGYVAVGFVADEAPFGFSTGASWASADGLEWRALAPFGTEFTGLDASASAGSGIVAFTVTTDEPDEVTVTSTIGAWFLPR